MKRSDKKKARKALRSQHEAEVAAGQVQLVSHARWYFVAHLSPEAQERKGGQFEVQFLDDQGRAAEYARYTSARGAIHLGGSSVPGPVLSAAEQLPAGQGCYVDTDGWELTPMGARVPADKARVTGRRETAS